MTKETADLQTKKRIIMRALEETGDLIDKNDLLEAENRITQLKEKIKEIPSAAKDQDKYKEKLSTLETRATEARATEAMAELRELAFAANAAYVKVKEDRQKTNKEASELAAKEKEHEQEHAQETNEITDDTQFILQTVELSKTIAPLMAAISKGLELIIPLTSWFFPPVQPKTTSNGQGMTSEKITPKPIAENHDSPMQSFYAQKATELTLDPAAASKKLASMQPLDVIGAVLSNAIAGGFTRAFVALNGSDVTKSRYEIDLKTLLQYINTTPQKKWPPEYRNLVHLMIQPPDKTRLMSVHTPKVTLIQDANLVITEKANHLSATDQPMSNSKKNVSPSSNEVSHTNTAWGETKTKAQAEKLYNVLNEATTELEKNNKNIGDIRVRGLKEELDLVKNGLIKGGTYIDKPALVEKSVRSLEVVLNKAEADFKNETGVWYYIQPILNRIAETVIACYECFTEKTKDSHQAFIDNWTVKSKAQIILDGSKESVNKLKEKLNDMKSSKESPSNMQPKC